MMEKGNRSTAPRETAKVKVHSHSLETGRRESQRCARKLPSHDSPPSGLHRLEKEAAEWTCRWCLPALNISLHKSSMRKMTLKFVCMSMPNRAYQRKGQEGHLASRSRAASKVDTC